MKNGCISIENARIGFKNFTGKGDKFNPVGKRGFCIFLEPELADKLADDGWNIRILKPREDADEGTEPVPYVQVAVSYKAMPPKVWMIANKKKELLTEETIDILDWSEIITVDLILSPYKWEVNGKVGIKAYLKTMYVTIEHDCFEDKYDFDNSDEEMEPDDHLDVD